MQKLSVDFERHHWNRTIVRVEEFLLRFGQLLLVHLLWFLEETQSQENLGPHDLVHDPVDFLLFAELFGMLKDFFKLHNQRPVRSQPIFAGHLFELFVDDHKGSFGSETGEKMDGLIAHKTGDRRFADLLGDYDYVPVVELMGDVFDGVFATEFAARGFAVLSHLTHVLLVQPNVYLGKAIHLITGKITEGLEHDIAIVGVDFMFSQEQVEVDVFIGLFYRLQFPCLLKICTPSTARTAIDETTPAPLSRNRATWVPPAFQFKFWKIINYKQRNLLLYSTT